MGANMSSGLATITVNGQPMAAPSGQSLAGALLAARHDVFRRTRRNGKPRTIFCGIGVCYDCLVTVDGVAGRRACMTPVREGMSVRIGGVDG